MKISRTDQKAVTNEIFGKVLAMKISKPNSAYRKYIRIRVFMGHN